MVVKAPVRLTCDCSTEKLSLRLSFLRDLLNIEERETGKLQKAIMKKPDILYWPEKRMVEVRHWIAERLGLNDSRIAQMCRNVPDVLHVTSKIETLGEKVDWVQTALSLSDDEVCELFGRYPPLFVCNPEQNLEPKLQFLRLTFELSDDVLKEMLLRMPALFCYSEKTMEMKLNFYTKLIGESAAKKLVIERPYLIGNFSLENRLEPRLEEVRKSGEKVKWDETMISRLATRTNGQWGKYGLGDAK